MREKNNGWGGRIRTHEWRDQNPLPYHLATPQKLEHNKNTIFHPILSLSLVFFLFSYIYFGKLSAKTSNLAGANSLSAEAIDAIFTDNDYLIYSQASNVFINSSRLELRNNFNADDFFRVYRIKKLEDDIFLASSQGLFIEKQINFDKFPVFDAIKIKKNLYLATEQGIYQKDIKEKKWGKYLDLDFKVYLLVEFQKQILAITENGIFKINTKKKSYEKFNHGLEFNEDFDLYRSFAIKVNDSSILLAMDNGIFQVNYRSKSWSKISDSSQFNPNLAQLEIIDLSIWQDYIFLTLENSIYYCKLENKAELSSWQKIDIKQQRLDENYSYGISAIDFQELSQESLLMLIGNNQGKLFKYQFSINGTPRNLELSSSKYYQSKIESNHILEDDLGLRLKLEPKLEELYSKALKFAAIPTGKKLRAYNRSARLRNLLPQFSSYLDQSGFSSLVLNNEGFDEFDSKESSIRTRFEENSQNSNDDEIEFGFRFTWHLDRLIYDPEVLDIVNSSRLIANIRENLLAELNQIYFERKALILKLLDNPFEQRIENILEYESLTANLDARTGSWLSKEYKKRKRKYEKKKSKKA